ncbi:MAG: radical SAM protein [Desulfobacterales bacterium]
MSLEIKGWKGLMPKRAMAEKVLGQALKYLGKDTDKNAKYVLKAVDHIASGEKQEMVREWFHHWMRENGPGRQFLYRVVQNTHPRVRERYVGRMVASMFFRDPEAPARAEKKFGLQPPSVMLISPTMRCNYRCEGCYASSYSRADDMDPEVFDRLLGEAEEMGLNFITILGGEPFIYPDLLRVLEKHDKSFFQIYTNGSFIDAEMADRLVRMGNIAPQISINGPGDYTDATRGKGAFNQCLQAMDNLYAAGCAFGFSSLVTRKNMDAICSEEWIDFLIERGALYGWMFLFMPVGSEPDMKLMPTPKQRDQMRRFQNHVRENKPLLLVDFWNDGVLSGGCIAGGRLYFHINHRGDVEPCIFCHFATDNIHDKPLTEALNSSFFQGIRAEQPFCYNTLRPCPMIDHPQTMWRIIQEHGAEPTHEGAETMFTELESEMNTYADGVRQVMDHAWENEGYKNWAGRWMQHCGLKPNQIERRRREFEKFNENTQADSDAPYEVKAAAGGKRFKR